DDAFWLFDVLAFLSRLAGREPPVGYEELRALEPAAQVQGLLAGLREINFLPPGAGELQVRRLLRVYKANARAGGRYRPGPYGGRLTLLRAADVPSGGDSTLGWGELVNHPVEVREVPGDHVTLLSESNVGGLAAQVRRCLRSPEGGVPQSGVHPDATMRG
ncbi:MAG: hypothetical protein GY856_34540, partial [bacterium]|nr:hypothetical protein [bacterium]